MEKHGMEQIRLTSADQLARIGSDPSMPAMGDYVLACDITVNSSWRTLPGLVGISLDGAGHKVGPLNAPLFLSLSDSTIKNIVIDVSIDASGDSSPNGCGAIGGLAQQARRTLFENCAAHGFVRGSFAVGGLCGNLSDCDMKNCENFANVSVSSAGAAGLCAFSGNTNFFSCVNHGSVETIGVEGTAETGDIGGIVGTVWAVKDTDEFTYAIVDCLNEGNVSGHRVCGGIVGLAHGGTGIHIELLRCVNRGNVSLTDKAAGSAIGGVLMGGILGQGVAISRVQDCINSGDVTGVGSVGGIVGELRHKKWGLGVKPDELPNGNIIENCLNRGIVTQVSRNGTADPSIWSDSAEGKTGGIAGAVLYIGSILNCENAGSVISDSSYVGGVAGLCKTCAIRKCENNACVSARGANAGGIVGHMDRTLCEEDYPLPQSHNISVVEECVNRGDISCRGDAAGGIAGSLRNGCDIVECHNHAKVACVGEYAGGIVGFSASSVSIWPNTITRSVALGGMVSGARHAHRILGGRDEAAAVSLSDNNARSDTVIQGDNTIDSGVVYVSREAYDDDPMTGADGFHGETIG